MSRGLDREAHLYLLRHNVKDGYKGSLIFTVVAGA
jgi:hypothetical protein